MPPQFSKELIGLFTRLVTETRGQHFLKEAAKKSKACASALASFVQVDAILQSFQNWGKRPLNGREIAVKHTFNATLSGMRPNPASHFAQFGP